MFSSTHNHDTTGHGEWLSTAPLDSQSKISFKNFEKVFQKKVKKQSMSVIARVGAPMVPVSSCSLSPTMTTDELKGGPLDFSSPPRTGRSNTLAYSDLKVTHDQTLVDPVQAQRVALMKQSFLQTLLEEHERP